MAKRMHPRPLTVALAWSCPVLIGLTGCSDGEGPADESEVVTAVFEEYGDAFRNLPLVRGQASTFRYTRAWPPGLQVSAVEVDVLGSLPHVSLTMTSTGGLSSVIGSLVSAQAAASTAEITVRVAGEAGAETVCETGRLYGPYTVGLDLARTLVSVEPSNANGAADTVAIINQGLIVSCIRVVAPFDALFSMDGLELDVRRKACVAPPADLAGRWVGTYECTSSCSENFGGDVELTITKVKEDQFRYSDAGGDLYRGFGCGAEFRFARNEPQETENGTFTLQADGSAIKRSRWRGTSPPFCSGECTDVLHRE